MHHCNRLFLKCHGSPVPLGQIQPPLNGPQCLLRSSPWELSGNLPLTLLWPCAKRLLPAPHTHICPGLFLLSQISLQITTHREESSFWAQSTVNALKFCSSSSLHLLFSLPVSSPPPFFLTNSLLLSFQSHFRGQGKEGALCPGASRQPS